MKKEILKSSLYLGYVALSVVKAILFIPYIVIKSNDEILEQIKRDIKEVE